MPDTAELTVTSSKEASAIESQLAGCGIDSTTWAHWRVRVVLKGVHDVTVRLGPMLGADQPLLVSFHRHSGSVTVNALAVEIY